MNSFVLSFLAAFAGVCAALQAPINAELRGGLNSALWANFFNFIIGLVLIVLAAAVLRAPLPSLALAERAPWWAWAGGFLGAVYVGLAILLVPRLGAAAFITLLVAGQMIASVLLDHFGLLGLAQRPLNLSTMLGVALVIGGVLLIRR